jgi:DNA-binding beta-propeller fold protein YncE
VVVLEPDGSRHFIGYRGNGDGAFNFPTTLAAANGWLWVGDTLNFRIQRLDPNSGVVLGTFGRLGDHAGEMPRIKGIAIDSAGHPWVSDAHLDRVSVYSTEGELLISIGSGGSAPGQFSFPAGVAAHPSGRVAVVDMLNRRVQIFRVMASEREIVQGGKNGPSW